MLENKFWFLFFYLANYIVGVSQGSQTQKPVRVWEGPEVIAETWMAQLHTGNQTVVTELELQFGSSAAISL